jgi:hypothetical protein
MYYSERANVTKNCGWQDAWFDISTAHERTPGAIYKRICSRGGSVSDLSAILSTVLDEEDEDSLVNSVPIEESNLSANCTLGNDINFRYTNFELDVDGMMKIDRKSFMYSSYEVILWKPIIDNEENIEDTIIDEEQILARGFVKMTNNNLIMDGAFSSKFDTFSIDTMKYAQFTGSNFTYTFTPGDSLLEEVAVTCISDGGPDEVALMEHITKSGMQIEDIQISPNPSTDQIKIKLNDLVDDYYSIKLLDVRTKGKLLYMIFSNRIAQFSSSLYLPKEKILAPKFVATFWVSGIKSSPRAADLSPRPGPEVP